MDNNIKIDEKFNVRNINTTALAYLGDAVYELKIRNHLLRGGEIHGDMLHRKAIRYVSAAAQAKTIRDCLEYLTEEERSLVRRARNRKITSKPANVSPMTYKWATALEALIGFLYLECKTERMNEILDLFIEHAEKNNR